MIPVSNNLKNAVLNEEMPKTLTVESMLDEQLPLLNWYKLDNPPYKNSSKHYTGTLAGGNYSVSIYDDFLSVDDINYDFIDSDKYSYFVVAVDVLFSSVSGDLSDRQLSVTAHLVDSDSQWVRPNAWNSFYAELCIGKWVRFFCTFPRSYLRECGANSLRNCLTYNFNGGYFSSLSYDIWVTQPHIYYSSWAKLYPYSEITAINANIEKYITPYNFDSFSNSKIISESFSFEESVCSADQFKIGGCETAKLELTAFDIPQIPIGEQIRVKLNINGKGTFTWSDFFVKSVEKSSKGGSVLKKITAYDVLDNLSQNAYAWYSQYMFGMNLVRSEPYANYRFDFERQIFSTYWNLATSFGVEDADIEIGFGKHTYGVFTPVNEKISDLYFDVVENVGADQYGRVHLSKKTYIPNYSDKAIQVMVNVDMLSGDMNFYKRYYDSLGRGVGDLASVYITFHLSGGGEQGFLLDNGDLVLIPDDCTSFDVYVPYSFCKPNFTDSHLFATNVAVYGVGISYYNPNNVINMKEPLPYYSYVWRKPTVDNICRASSSITARDVMRSLMEMCGCFYRFNRRNRPQFIYAQEHGLYPSNTLYPADDLFPKKSSELTMPTSYYISAEFAEFQVEKYGGVQVVVDTKDNTGAVCRWEYWGDNTSDNAYLIDDNIFLCAEEFVYDAQNTGNIDTLLQNLYGVLDNLQYTPFTAETIGTPFLESGDRFTLLTKNDGFESFIFERKLKGIQALKDHFEARGIAKTPRVKNFEWES